MSQTSYLEVLSQPLLFGRLRDGDDPVLHRPPDQDLGRASTHLLRNLDDRRLAEELPLGQRAVTLRPE